jgi:hypothetical protein
VSVALARQVEHALDVVEFTPDKPPLATSMVCRTRRRDAASGNSAKTFAFTSTAEASMRRCSAASAWTAFSQ